MNQLILSGIYIYPIKSLGGISLPAATVEEKGLQYDRRWMLIDEEGTFITQRKYAVLALLQVRIDNNRLIITHKHNAAQTVSFSTEEHTGKIVPVSIWDDQCQALEVSHEVSRWFSSFMEKQVRLVRMPDKEKRLVDPKYAHEQEIVSFADGYPFLIISEASLTGLNTRLQQPVPMDRFRPNFVFTGGEPHIEDQFHTFTIGGILFRAVKPCARCVLTTVDQKTGEKSAEPLKTLASYRTKNKKVMFGQNLLHTGSGTVQIGHVLEIREWQPSI